LYLFIFFANLHSISDKVEIFELTKYFFSDIPSTSRGSANPTGLLDSASTAPGANYDQIYACKLFHESCLLNIYYWL
jgi:hypothetical protein